jgi:HAD superfamily hydrolase (TIGR01459 family)
MTPYYDNIIPLIERYDGFILDLWGVIHDGQSLYPGVKDALELLKTQQKHVIFLSNAPRRASRAMETLERLGITADLYDQLISSGEITYELIKTLQEPFAFLKPSSYIEVGPTRDHGLLDGLPYTPTHEIKNASFLLVTGYDQDNSPLDEKQAILDEAITYDLPLICANPDDIVVRIDGSKAYCAGLIAKQYARMGGTVISIGKPFDHVYTHCLKAFTQITPDKICAIGDSLDTDIKGALTQDLDAYLVTSGILTHALGMTPCSKDKHIVTQYCQEKNINPTGYVESFGRTG